MIRPYERARDLERIQLWAKAVGEEINGDSLPRTGFIEEDYLVGFLYCTDSDIGFLEVAYFRPGCDLKKAWPIAIRIVEMLMAIARNNGIKRLVLMTKRASIGKFFTELAFDKADGDWSVYWRGI